MGPGSFNLCFLLLGLAGIEILDSEIRLIVPTDPEGNDEDDDSVKTRILGRLWQLRNGGNRVSGAKNDVSRLT